jgi:RNA polymerase sigma factor (sigma-70 family)
MMTTEQMPAAENNDAELVAESLAGQRDAFRLIVERYQSLICSLAYSATGSLCQSEDLAQETFVNAWGQLALLREPAKLRAWLCGIARNRIGKALRRDGREPAHAAEPIEAVVETHAPEPLPADHAISCEEESILWRSLERIPGTYREPLVLFYREHQSIENVAEALGLSKDAVKQRLSRGRKLLHEEVMAFVEGTLERTNPGPAFTLGVLAAIPWLSSSAKAATVGAVAVAGKGSGIAKGAGMLGAAGLAGMALAALSGGIAALWGRVQGGRSARERRFLARSSWGVLAWKILLLVAILTVASFSGDVIVINRTSDAVPWVLTWLVLLGLWVAYSIWMARRQRQIQLDDGVPSAVAGPDGDIARPGLAAQAYGGLAAWIFGPGGLLIVLVHHQGNGLVAGLLLVVAVATWLAYGRAIVRRPERIRRIFHGVWWGQALITLATVNLLWGSWITRPEVLWPDHPHGFHPAPFVLNFLISVFYGSLGLAWWLQRRLTAGPAFRHDRTASA